MVFFKKKSDSYVDLSERLAKQESKLANFKENNSNNEVVDMTAQSTDSSPQIVESGGFFNFFGGSSSASATQSEPQTTSIVEDKRKRLNDVLRNLTNKLEEQEKEIYQMKQRIEVLERKQRVGY